MKLQLKKNIIVGSVTAAGGILISIIGYPLYLFFLGTEKTIIKSVVEDHAGVNSERII